SLLALQPDLVIYNFDMSDVADDHRHRRQTRMSAAGVPLMCADPVLDTKRRSAGQQLEERFLVVKWCRHQLGELPVENDTSSGRDIDSPLGRYAWLRNNPPEWSIYVEQALTPLDQLNTLMNGSFSRFVVAVCAAPWQASPTASSGDGVRSRVGVPESTRFE